MAKIAGRIADKESGEKIEARVQVISSGGVFLHPEDAILKVGNGLPFFYSDGDFAVDAPRGITQVLVERGTEYVPAQLSLDVPAHGTVAVDVEMERWSDLGDKGWHPGNTHIHYNQDEKRPDERLHLDPRVEDLRFTAISILTRRDFLYASNKYPPGVLTEFCSAHHHVECGEESRHNQQPWEIGYGHIMLLRIKEVVQPISRGLLVDDTDPDYPPLCYACDDAHRQGGIVIWCHNGIGMEAPVAAALGKLDAFNLFDPYWMDPEYDLWYAMLNCGFKLPASTGSDWFICSANRVYAYTGGAFAYADWMQALQGGRTFITNGPALFLSVDDRMPGETVPVEPGKELTVIVSWQSHYPIQRAEVIWNGKVIAAQQFREGSAEGRFKTSVKAQADGWIAARLASQFRDTFFQPVYAHTSPVYVVTGLRPVEQREAAAQFDTSIEQALAWVNRQGRFQNDKQRNEVVNLFRQGQAVYKGLSGGK
ncbi:MAG: CehA/McbA family metallohydrolase [Anaerolineae bacterium]|nr:CehA/McbA family metallohydrolase [Anaerolineae bacterium]